MGEVMNKGILNLIRGLFVVSVLLLLWTLPGSADSGLVKVTSTKSSVAMELFGHPVSGTTAITPVMAATEICFPHFADSSSWWTGIAIANPGESPAFVTLRAYNDSGEQIDKDCNRIIPPQSQMEPSVIHTLFALGGAETGWIKLISSQPVVALEIFGHTDSSGIAGFSPAPAATEICIPHFAEEKDWWTGIAVANPGTVTARISITALSDAGDQIGAPYEVSIDGGCRMTPQIIRNIISLGEHTSGWLKITATRPVAAMEIFGQFTTSMIAGLSAGEAGTKLYYPYFQEGSGNWTGIAIANPGTTAALITLKALDGGGDTVGVVDGLVIPAFGRMTPQAITGLFGSLEDETGYLEVTANYPVAGLGLLGGNGWLAGYTAVKEQTDTHAFPHFADSSGWWTKLALVNTSDGISTLSMAAYGVTGTLVGEEKDVELGPDAAVVENLPFSNSAADPIAEVTQTIGISGGTLTSANSLGDVISLEIPIGALLEDTEITLRSLNVPLSDPIAKNVFPGVEILPDGVTFLVPAKLKVVLAESFNREVAVLYQVKTAEFVVPLDDMVATETSIEGYISHLSDYGGGEPTSDEGAALLDAALEESNFSGSSNYRESQEAVSYALAICEEILLKSGDDSCKEEISRRVLKEVQDFLKRPRPEPPCDPNYMAEAFAYAEMIRVFGLPSFNNSVLDAAAQAVFQQTTDLISEIIQRCAMQINLYISEIIDTEVMTITYIGEINLGLDAYGYSGDSTSIYGPGSLPVVGSGGFGGVDYTAEGIWAIVASGSLDIINSEHGSFLGFELNLKLEGHVAQWMVSCSKKQCIENESDYEKDKTFTIRLIGGAPHTQIEMESFEGGNSTAVLTVEMVGKPMAQ